MLCESSNIAKYSPRRFRLLAMAIFEGAREPFAFFLRNPLTELCSFIAYTTTVCFVDSLFFISLTYISCLLFVGKDFKLKVGWYDSIFMFHNFDIVSVY